MAILAGGAMRILDRRSRSAGIADDCIGFLDLVWHGAHDGGSGIDPDIHVRVPIAEDTPDGQFEFYFCSTACLRSFLNERVNALESKIQNEHTRRARRFTPKRERRKVIA